jgi:hypothetical protein
VNGFWFRYIFAALAGTAAVYFGVPRLNSRLPDDLVHRAASTRTVVEAAFSDIRNTVAPEGPPPADVSPVPEAAPSPTPAPNGAPGWGVVLEPDTACYDRHGKFQRRLPAGTLLDILKIADTAAGEFAVCTVHLDGRAVPNVVIRTTDLDLQPGTRADTHPLNIQMHVRRARLRGQIAELEQQLTTVGRSRNPHAGQFEALVEQYRALQEKAAELTRTRDEAVGAERMKAADDLRAMKQESSLLKQRYDEIKRRHTEWQESYVHSVDGIREKKALEAEIARKQEELDRVEDAL